MGNYFRLQCKRMLRFLPGALFVAVVLLCSVLVAFQFLTAQTANREENRKVPFAICGDTDHTFLQMGLSVLTNLDNSRFALEIVQMEEDAAAQALTRGDISAYVVIPDGFMDAAFSGKILPIKFYTTAGATGIVSLVKEELSAVVSQLLISSQKGVFGMWDAMVDNGLGHKTDGQMDQLALVYMDYILARDRIYTLQELGIADALGFESYILCGLCVFFLLLICLPFAPLLIPGDPALGRMLCSAGKPAWRQALCDFLAYAVTLLCLLLVLAAVAKLCAPQVLQLTEILPKILPVLLFTAAFSFMLYALCSDIISGILLPFFVIVFFCFVSGCLYPVFFFPTQVQQFAQWLPTGIARAQLASCITGSAPVWTLPVLLGYSAGFLAIGAGARVRHIQEVAQ